jgi:hypothetical protein
MPANPSLVRALLPLTAIFRAAMSRQFGVRAAKLMGLMALAGFVAAIWLVSDRDGSGASALSLLSRSALLVVVSCGTVAGLSLARSAKDGVGLAGIVALAQSRGFSPAEIDLSETLASLRIAVETVLGPIAAIGLAAFAIAAGQKLPGIGRVVLGTAAFGAIAAVGVGLLANACRRWGGARGRSWFVVVVAVPWLAVELMTPPWGSEYLSIPGLVGHAWKLLAAGDL